MPVVHLPQHTEIFERVMGRLVTRCPEQAAQTQLSGRSEQVFHRAAAWAGCSHDLSRCRSGAPGKSDLRHPVLPCTAARLLLAPLGPNLLPNTRSLVRTQPTRFHKVLRGMNAEPQHLHKWCPLVCIEPPS